MKGLVLASASPRRRELLEGLGLEFVIRPSKIEEESIEAVEAVDFVRAVARAKARDVRSREQGVVVAADTVVCYRGKILGKPENKGQALEMLETLAGTTHRVLTGVAIASSLSGKEAVSFEETQVYFREADKEELENYIQTGEPMDKAGAYAIQGLGAVFISRIEGCYFNVVGLPLFRLHEMLASFGLSIFPRR